MLAKSCYVVFLFMILGIQAHPHVEISKLEKTQCSKTVGITDLTFNYASSYTENADSFFLIKFLDKTNKKRPTICKLTLNEKLDGPDGPDKPNGPDGPDEPNGPDEPVAPPIDIDELLKKLLEKLRNDIEKSLKGGIKIVNQMLVFRDDFEGVINFGMLKDLKKIMTKMHVTNEQLELLVQKSIGIPLKDTLMKLKEILTNFNQDDLKEDLNRTICHISRDLINVLSNNKLKNLTNSQLMKLLEKFKNSKKNNKIFKQLDEIMKLPYLNKTIPAINGTLTSFNQKIVEQLKNLQVKVNEIEDIKKKYNQSNITGTIEEKREILQYMLKNLKETIQYFLKNNKLGGIIAFAEDKNKEIIKMIDPNNKIAKSFKNYIGKIKELDGSIVNLLYITYDVSAELKKLILESLVSSTNSSELINQLTMAYDYQKNISQKLKDLNGTEIVNLQEEFLKNMFNSLKNKINNTNNTVLKDKLEKLSDFNMNITNKLSEKKLVDKFKEQLANVIDRLKQLNENKLNELLKAHKYIQEQFRINNSTEIIKNVETSLNDFKNDYINKLSNLSQSIPDLIRERMNNSKFIQKLKEFLEDIKNKTELLMPDEKENPISNHSDFKILPLKESFNKLKEKIAESKTGIFFENLEESIYNCDIESIKDLLQIERIKNEVEKIKGYLNQSNATFLVEKERESVRGIMNEIKSKISVSVNNSKFTPLINKLKDINSNISDTFKKMKIYEDFRKFATKMKAANNATVALYEKIQIFILNSYFTLKNNIPLNVSSQINYLNELGKELQEQLKKLKDMETNTAKIKYILDSTLRLNKDHRESIDILLKILKKKAEETNKTQLLKLVEKLNEINTEANKISEEKVKVFFDKIINIVDKMEYNYDNAETLFQEKNEKLKKDLEELVSFNLTGQLNISYEQTLKNAEEYQEILQGINEYYKNLPEGTNMTEILEKHKILIIVEIKKMQQSVKEIFSDLDIDLNKLKNHSNIVGKILNSSLFNNLPEKLHEYKLQIIKLIKYLGKKNILALDETTQKILDKIATNNSNQLREFFEKMKKPIFWNGTSKLNETISFLIEINSKINKTELSEDTKKLAEIFKELSGYLMIIKNNPQLRELILETYLQSGKITLTNLKKQVRKKNIDIGAEINNLIQIQFLLDDIKEILSSSSVIKDIAKAFREKSSLRIFSALSKGKNRRLDSTGQLLCKMDQFFSENEELKPATSNLSLYLLSEKQYELSISRSLQIIVKKEEFNCNTDHIAKLRSIYSFKGYSNIRVEKQKLRIKFMIHVKKVAKFTRPSFFYIILKFRYKFAVQNLRRLVDENENIDSYCLLNDESNEEDNTFDCFAYPDNINELENLEGIQNITSDYINVPDGAGENNNGNSTVPDNYNVGINNFKTKKGKPLSGGAIAGIVLSCIAVLAIIIGLIIYSKSKVVQPIAVSKSYNSTDIVRITNN